MHKIITSNGYSQIEAVDIDSLLLPDGRKAVSVDRDLLFRALAVLQVPGINATMGRQELLINYARHLNSPGAAA